jgi:hypothetical protein
MVASDFKHQDPTDDLDPEEIQMNEVIMLSIMEANIDAERRRLLISPIGRQEWEEKKEENY